MKNALKKNTGRRGREPKKRDQIDLTSNVKNAFKEIQQHCMVSEKSLHELLSVAQLAVQFNMSVERAALFVTIYCRTDNGDKITEKVIFAILKNYFQGESRTIRMELRELVRIDFVKRYQDEGTYYYYLSPKITQALDEDQLATIANVGPYDLETSLEYFHTKLMDHDRLNQVDVERFLDDILDNNKDLNIVKYCEKDQFQLDTCNTYVLFAICAKAAISNDFFDFSYFSKYIEYNRYSVLELRTEILSGCWAPMMDGLVENAGNQLMEYDPQLKLTSKGFNQLLTELDPNHIKLIQRKLGNVQVPVLQPHEIEKVNLFFSESIKKQTDRLINLLMQSAFQKYQSVFPKNAKMKGVTILLHGEPGCGKTEFALQICRITNRPLVKIDVTDFQSKWIGESEKQLKQIFSDYKMLCQKMPNRIPILFFNECDQIIGKRTGVNNSVDQMSNAIQNILLEEMESFNGIFIGTTNLTQNMDKAFERRWLVKMKFESPDNSARINIWKRQIKGLRSDEAIKLTSQYALTPAEISNVAKKYSMEKLLGLTKTKMETLLELCEMERYNIQKSMLQIGF